MRLLVAISSVVLLTITAGCSNNNGGRLAPVNESDLGVIINLDEETVSTKYSDTKSISNAEVLPFTEIYGVSAQEVQSSFPEAKVFRNSFVKTESANFKLNQTQGFNALNLINQFNDSASSKKAFTLKDCVRAPSELASVIDIVDSENVPRFLDENGLLMLTSRNSKSRNKEEFETAWVIVPPTGSLLSPSLILEKDIEVKFDMAGVYQVNLFVKQGINCEVSTLPVPVTSNPEIKNLDAASSRAFLEAKLKDAAFTQKETMGVREAQARSLKGRDKVIAILDSGVNYNSPFFAGRIWQNKKEKLDGFDTDNNQLVNDVIGYDFVNDDEFPMDDNGHGTHVAGLAAGSLVGVASNALIMPVKVMHSLGFSDTGTILAGLTYAILNGADVINMSLGGSGIDPRIEDALISVYTEAERRDIVIVAAAGNGAPTTGLSMNIDRFPVYPASLGFKNILTVGSSDINGNLTYYSNYGNRSVDLLAMGGVDRDINTNSPLDELLFSAYLPNPQGILLNGLMGTSMAAPVVAGMTTLLRAEDENLTAKASIDLLKNSVDENPDLKGLINSSGIANINNALDQLPEPSLLF